MALHKPGCRITGLRMSQARPTKGENAMQFHPTANYPVSMFINFTIDPQIWFAAGNFHINYDIFQNGDRIFRHTASGWIATDLPGRPATNFWVDWSVYTATDITNGDRIGVFSFRPTVYFDMWGPGHSYIPDEFAVAEEDYVFGIE